MSVATDEPLRPVLQGGAAFVKACLTPLLELFMPECQRNAFFFSLLPRL